MDIAHDGFNNEDIVLPPLEDVSPYILAYRAYVLNRRLLESDVGNIQRIESELIRRGLSIYVDLEKS